MENFSLKTLNKMEATEWHQVKLLNRSANFENAICTSARFQKELERIHVFQPRIV